MKIKDLAEALQILAKYAGDDSCIQAEHDGVWIGDRTWPFTDAERTRLEELGFTDADDMGFYFFT